MMLQLPAKQTLRRQLFYLNSSQTHYQPFNEKPHVYIPIRTFTVPEKKEEKKKQGNSPQKGKSRFQNHPYFLNQNIQATKKEMRQYLWPMIFNDDTKKLFYTSTFLLGVSKCLAISSPFFLKVAVNALAEASKLDLNLACLGLLAFGVTRMLSTTIQEYRMNQIVKIIQVSIKKISLKSFNHLHALDIYFHKISSKNTVFAINKALRSIESVMRFTLGLFTPVAFEFAMLCVTLQLYCGTPYLLNMLITFSFYTVFSKKYSQYRQKIIRKRKNNEKASEFYLNESIMNYETVKAFNNEKLELSRYERLLNKLKDSALLVQRTLSNLNVGQNIIFTAGLTINLIMAAFDVCSGRLTPGDFVMIQAFFMQLGGPLNHLGTLFREIDQSQVDIEDLYYMLKQKPLITEKPNAIDFQYKNGHIEIKNVAYKHPLSQPMEGNNNQKKNEYLFSNLTLNIKPGTTNAIVGQSGFGKTTLINMISRIYDPSEGEIFIDGQNIKDLKFDSFRKYISVIPQNGILFNDTILFNLQYGNPDATMEQIQDIAKRCQIHDKIMEMENGYNTMVGDLGSKLSGGERQRILIARALLKKDAQIFLFDEATSNLDGNTEREITDELEELLSNKTVIYCAHRLSSIVNVDNIFVMADGKVVEQGTHWDLIENEKSIYAEMWKNYLREQQTKENTDNKYNMATGKLLQPKALLKLPKEIPSNIPDQKERKDSNTVAASRSKIDFTKIDISKLPSFKDVDPDKWKLLYVSKLKACYKLADFSDNKKDQEFKDQKKDTLIDLIDVLDDPTASQYLFNEPILKEAIKMIETNIFRTFTNKTNKKTSQVDPDEDEPHLEEAWPHLQLVYELLLKFVMTVYIPSVTIAQNISTAFIKQMLDLFDSEDPRERDYLKTIMHRIYGKFMALRPVIRVHVMNLLLKVTYEYENHNGLTELLEILSSIVSGFNSPLKQEHRDFFLRVIVPLHKVKQLSNFNTQLQMCVKNFLEKEPQLCIPLFKGLLKVWPITNPGKEVIFINEIEEIMEANPTIVAQKFQEYGPQFLKRIIKCAQSMHYQAAERSLLLLNSETIQKLVKQNKASAYPLIVKQLIQGSQQSHWDQAVTTITYSVMRNYMDMDPEGFEKLTAQAQTEEKSKNNRVKEIENKWSKLEEKYGTK